MSSSIDSNGDSERSQFRSLLNATGRLLVHKAKPISSSVVIESKTISVSEITAFDGLTLSISASLMSEKPLKHGTSDPLVAIAAAIEIEFNDVHDAEPIHFIDYDEIEDVLLTIKYYVNEAKEETDEEFHSAEGFITTRDGLTIGFERLSPKECHVFIRSSSNTTRHGLSYDQLNMLYRIIFDGYKFLESVFTDPGEGDLNF